MNIAERKFALPEELPVQEVSTYTDTRQLLARALSLIHI